MVNNINASKFFLGANSPFGFFSYFDYLYNPSDDWFCYILKGGPGSGKSNIMNKISLQALKKGIPIELICCPSDPKSLDAVIFPELKICIADGTFPHVLDPIYPGVSDIVVNLGEYWDTGYLHKNKDEIKLLSNRNLLFHTRSNGYLKACESIRNDIIRIASQSINKDKILSFSKRIAKKNFKKRDKLYGIEKKRFISAITPDGIIFFKNTISLMCNKLYIIEDRYNCVSSVILNYIRDFAINMGYNIITCFSPMSPKKEIECLIFPEIKLAFALSNLDHPINDLENVDCKKVNCNRFMNKGSLSSHSRILKFNRKFERELLEESIKNLNKAKSIHDKLENYYIKAMNFSGIDKISYKIMDEIL